MVTREVSNFHWRPQLRSFMALFLREKEHYFFILHKKIHFGQVRNNTLSFFLFFILCYRLTDFVHVWPGLYSMLYSKFGTAQHTKLLNVFIGTFYCCPFVP